MATGLCKRCNMLQARPGSTLCINCIQARRDIVSTTIGTVIVLAGLAAVIWLMAGCVTTPNVRLLDADGVSRILDRVEQHIDETTGGETVKIMAGLAVGMMTYVGNQVRKGRIRAKPFSPD